MHSPDFLSAVFFFTGAGAFLFYPLIVSLSRFSNDCEQRQKRRKKEDETCAVSFWEIVFLSSIEHWIIGIVAGSRWPLRCLGVKKFKIKTF